MTPDVNEFLTTIVLVSFVVTIVLAIGSYIVYKLRERARVPTLKPASNDGPMFFERFIPPNRVHDHPPDDASTA